MDKQKQDLYENLAWGGACTLTLLVLALMLGCPRTAPGTAEIDARVGGLRAKIDSMRATVDAQIQDSLHRNPYYWYMPTFDYSGVAPRDWMSRPAARRNVRNYYYDSLFRQVRIAQRQIDSLMTEREKLVRQQSR